jgi:tRNA threonylcarbamoyladenosine biosynthesis protein TsaE
MKSLNITTTGADETRQLGTWLGKLAQPGDIFLLSGNLGVGKTCLTQGIVWGLDSQEYALSPTFVLMRELHGRLPLYHIDLYRLDQIAEISDLGLDDYLYGQGVCVIEWAEKGLAVLPSEHLLVEIEYVDDSGRKFRMQAQGKRYEKLLSSLAGFVKKGILCK